MANVEWIWQVLPHRYPFLLIDRVLEVIDEQRAVAVKNVTIDEPFFTGHYPQKPVMPGVLIIEAMAQTGGVALGKKFQEEGRVPLLAGVEGARFRRMVTPGDQLRLEVDVLRIKNGVAKVQAQAKVDGQLVAEAELLFAFA